MQTRLEKAILAHRAGRLDDAERLYRSVLESTPDDANALHFLGLLLHQRGDSTRALALIAQALEICPEYADAHNNLGNIHEQNGQSAEAEACFRRAIALDGQDAGAWNNLCISLKNQRRFAEAVQAGGQAVALDPGSPGNWLNYGNALARAVRLREAASAYRRALQADPAFVPAHVELCHTLYRLRDMDGLGNSELMAAYQAWLEQDPGSPVARFMLSAAAGDHGPDRAPDAFVRSLFDGFAGSFDGKLKDLDYRVPGLIEQRLAESGVTARSSLDVLDAGCGTGLCGAFLARIARCLVGVDLSPGMLEKAAITGHYHELVEQELTAYLRDSRRRFDLVVCADTLVYFGSLSAALTAAAGALRPGARLLFTVESLADESASFRLNPSGRYAHSPVYIERCLAETGLQAGLLRPVTLRRESGKAVAGLLVEAAARA